jgi:AraC-like DNA-binding protein
MKKKVIVVEDSILIAYDIKEILLQEDYEPIINITTVKEAIEAIEEHDPLIVLIDIKLRNGDLGTTIGEYLLNKATIPFVYITSHSDKQTLELVNHTRPHGFIVKPFKERDILSTISIVLNNFNHRFVDIERSSSAESDQVPYKIKEIINYIAANLDKKIEIEELAAKTPWKRDHFSKLFLNFLGCTPYQYILNKKIEKAKVLITETDINISQISFELGFNSYSNFCNAFKKITNYTPENYRKFKSKK